MLNPKLTTLLSKSSLTVSEYTEYISLCNTLILNLFERYDEGNKLQVEYNKDPNSIYNSNHPINILPYLAGKGVTIDSWDDDMMSTFHLLNSLWTFSKTVTLPEEQSRLGFTYPDITRGVNEDGNFVFDVDNRITTDPCVVFSFYLCFPYVRAGVGFNAMKTVTLKPPFDKPYIYDWFNLDVKKVDLEAGTSAAFVTHHATDTERYLYMSSGTRAYVNHREISAFYDPTSDSDKSLKEKSRIIHDVLTKSLETAAHETMHILMHPASWIHGTEGLAEYYSNKYFCDPILRQQFGLDQTDKYGEQSSYHADAVYWAKFDKTYPGKIAALWHHNLNNPILPETNVWWNSSDVADVSDYGQQKKYASDFIGCDPQDLWKLYS